MEKKKLIVELEPGKWYAEFLGEPGVTSDRNSAKEFETRVECVNAKARAHRIRRFADAKFVEK